MHSCIILHFFKAKPKNSSLTFFNKTRYIKLSSRNSYYTCNNQRAITDQLEQNQAALREEVSQVHTQMGQLMETIQVVARGKEIMAKIQEDMQQRANDATNPATMETLVPPQGNPPVQIPTTTPCIVPPPVINPPVIEIDG